MNNTYSAHRQSEMASRSLGSLGVQLEYIRLHTVRVQAEYMADPPASPRTPPPLTVCPIASDEAGEMDVGNKSGRSTYQWH